MQVLQPRHVNPEIEHLAPVEAVPCYALPIDKTFPSGSLTQAPT